MALADSAGRRVTESWSWMKAALNCRDLWTSLKKSLRSLNLSHESETTRKQLQRLSGQEDVTVSHGSCFNQRQSQPPICGFCEPAKIHENSLA